jgi:nucleoside-diphosphate-sugar epimerase
MLERPFGPRKIKKRMKIIITGNRGFIGTYVEQKLVENNFTVIGYDLIDGNDICDYKKLKCMAKDCDVIIHLAAVDNDVPVDIMNTNIIGTMNILNIFNECNCKKLIFLSSVDSLGIFQGEDKPKYLPIDEKYPCHPKKAYSISKYSNEKMCEYNNTVFNKPILCIRAPGVWSEDTYKVIKDKRIEDPKYEWFPYWEYGAFVDVRDLSNAILQACKIEWDGYHCVLISSDDITTSGKTSVELVKYVFPDIEWRGDNSYSSEPYKSIINNSKIKKLLDWSPEYSWRNS